MEQMYLGCRFALRAKRKRFRDRSALLDRRPRLDRVEHCEHILSEYGKHGR